MLKDYTYTRCCRKKYDCLTPFIQCEDVIQPIINPKEKSLAIRFPPRIVTSFS